MSDFVDDKDSVIAELKKKIADYENCVAEQRKLAETLRERESEIADLKRQGPSPIFYCLRPTFVRLRSPLIHIYIYIYVEKHLRSESTGGIADRESETRVRHQGR
jgi:hypothetical protein